MSETLARRERAALCNLAIEVGPEAPTLCAGWAAKDLVVHLLVRERRPLGTAGIVLTPFARFTARASNRLARDPYGDLVHRLRSVGWLFALPGVDTVANTIEYLVHHEDLRRAQPDWQPRRLDPADVDALWAQLGRSISFVGRKLSVPTVLRRAGDGVTMVARKGPDPVTVTGPVVELLLFVFGRSAVRDLSFEGPDERVAALRAADLSA